MSIAERDIQPLRAGQRLTFRNSLRRREAMPEVKFPGLIDGVVYMPSPQTSDHERTEDQDRRVDCNVHRQYTGL